MTKKLRKYPEWFIEELVDPEIKQQAIEGTLSTVSKVEFRCRCGNTYIQKITNHINLSTGERRYGNCKDCSKKVQIQRYRESIGTNKPYPEWFINDLVNEVDKKRAKEGLLKTNDKVNITCPICGYSFIRSAGYFLKFSTLEKRYFCPICAKQRSNTELEIEEYIKSLGIVTEHRRFCSSILKLFELDIYIPDKKIAIEYNGSFWHKTLPQDVCNKQKMYHNKKYWSCRELGIQLISIFDVDWCYRKDKIKQYLKDLLLPISDKIYARKCVVKNITKEEANSMYEEYHLLGRTTVQDVSYGLFYNNNLIACMSFQNGRYKDNSQPIWCLTRFVTKSGFSIIGGASKLLKQFEKEFQPAILVSYSDNDYFTGKLYSKLGFVCSGDTKAPRYYWFLDNKEIKREQCQLKYLARHYPELYLEALTIDGNKEDYIMLHMGAYKVYRSGHTKWIKRYSE